MSKPQAIRGPWRRRAYISGARRRITAVKCAVNPHRMHDYGKLARHRHGRLAVARPQLPHDGRHDVSIQAPAWGAIAYGISESIPLLGLAPFARAETATWNRIENEVKSKRERSLCLLDRAGPSSTSTSSGFSCAIPLRVGGQRFVLIRPRRVTADREIITDIEQFQSTPPRWGRRLHSQYFRGAFLSIHTPVKGATRSRPPAIWKVGGFDPRPGNGATLACREWNGWRWFSIHAPAEGETNRLILEIRNPPVSIHAPGTTAAQLGSRGHLDKFRPRRGGRQSMRRSIR